MRSRLHTVITTTVFVLCYVIILVFSRSHRKLQDTDKLVSGSLKQPLIDGDQ